MDQHTPDVFQPGTQVIYGMHGKCSILAVENRELSGQSVSFYKLEIQKSALSRSNRQEPAIWVPVANARERGLRAPITQEIADAVFSVFSNREYFFSLSDSWSTIHPQLEAVVRAEGAIGLAKAVSYLHVLKKRQVVPSSEVNRTYETMSRLLLRELSELLNEPMRAIEERIIKMMRTKLLPDQ